MTQTPKTPREASAKQREHDAALEAATQAWITANERFAKLSTEAKVRPAVREEYRLAAIVAYEALLDAVISVRDGLTLLDAVRSRHIQKPKRPEA